VRLRGGATALILIFSILAGGCAARRPPGATPLAPGAGPAASSTSPGPEAADAPLVREIVLEGVTAYTPATVYRAIVLRPGGRLKREPATYAADLERRYQARGYLGARVGATWDADRGVLTLRADEGRLRELEVTGVEGGAEAQARTLLALKTGEILTEKDVRAGLRRLEDGSGGAFRRADPPYSVEPLTEGVRLKLAVAPVRTKLRVRLQGPDLSPLANRVEGFSPGAGVDLTLFDPSALDHARVYARAAYGFASETWRFALGAQRPFAGHRLVLGYEFHDMTDTDDAFRKYPIELGPGIVRFAAISEEYFRRRGHEAYAFLRPTPRLHVGVSYRHDLFESLPIVAKDSIFFFKRTARPNPEIDEGTRDSVLFTARWAAGAPLYPTPVKEGDAFLVREPYGDRLQKGQSARVDTSFELGGSVPGGSPSYRRFLGHVRTRSRLTTSFSVDSRLLLGFGSDLPAQRVFALGGMGTLRGYPLKGFRGQNAALGTVEGRLRLPQRWPDVIAFYDGGAVWTSGIDGRGYRDDAGFSLEWPGGGEGRVRVDGAYALRPLPGQRRARAYATIILPF
jgi:hypothetical protein